MLDFLYTLSEEDNSLLKKLNLPIPQKLSHWVETHVGKIKYVDNSYIDIWVTASPAEFWRFVIWCKSTRRKFEIKTGDGSLHEFFPFAEQLSHGMIDVKELEVPK